MNAEWVSVNDRMPEDRIRVIAAYAPHKYIVGDCFYGRAGQPLLRRDPKNDVRCWRHTGGERPVPEHSMPTHWMPLPEAPESPR